ncbi:lysostaphin resistance A-like protein [Viridibacillus arvi]|uniref:lysostaphin resistance A-like protein n=1 Tax=Viridibacillus arvi TaxID=263475 RepID=UPI0034CD99CF
MKSNSQEIMPLNEFLLWATVITLSALSYYLNQAFVQILLFWSVIIIVHGFIKRINSDKHYMVALIIRRSFYVIPLFIPLLMYRDFTFKSNVWLWCLLSLLIGFLFLLPKLKEWKLALHNDFIIMMVTRSKSHYLLMIFVLVGSAVGEEFFFRHFILTSLHEFNPVFVVLLSGCLFVLYHFGTKWGGNFKKYDIIVQFLFGIISGILFVCSGSVLPCIIAHLVYNSPHVIMNYKSLKFAK